MPAGGTLLRTGVGCSPHRTWAEPRRRRRIRRRPCAQRRVSVRSPSLTAPQCARVAGHLLIAGLDGLVILVRLPQEPYGPLVVASGDIVGHVVARAVVLHGVLVVLRAPHKALGLALRAELAARHAVGNLPSADLRAAPWLAGKGAHHFTLR